MCLCVLLSVLVSALVCICANWSVDSKLYVCVLGSMRAGVHVGLRCTSMLLHYLWEKSEHFTSYIVMCIDHGFILNHSSALIRWQGQSQNNTCSDAQVECSRGLCNFLKCASVVD